MSEEDYSDRLRMALGDDAETLTDSERAVAKRVIDWAFGLNSDEDEDESSTVKMWAGAIREALVAYSGLCWEMIRGSWRNKQLTELRYIAFHILWKNTGCVKSHIGEALGIARHHATILHGLEVCEDWLATDRAFREDYKMIVGLVNARFRGVDIQKVCEKLNK